MIVREITHKNGERTERWVDYATGQELQHVPGRGTTATVSMSNGIIGGEAVKRQHERFDAQNGVRDCVRYESIGHGGYVAHFNSRQDKNRWLRAHNRVDLDAGYGDPAPSKG